MNDQSTQRRRWTHGALGLLVFLSVGYFQNTPPGWNVNSTFDLTCAIAERGTLRIDAYHMRPDMGTNDKAYFEGHYYSDKSPVTALLAVPAFWVYRHLTGAFDQPFSYDRARYWTTWWSIGLAAAALAMMLATLLERRGVARAWAVAGAGLWWLATPLLGYSILLFNYLPACAFALGGWLLVESVWREPERAPSFGGILAGGFLWGLAAWTLNTMALPAVIVNAGILAGALRSRGGGVPLGRLSHLIRCGAPWVLGGALGVAGYYIYNYAIFHSIASPYVYESDAFFREQMSQGFMGAGRPRPRVAWLLTFHPFQGLFLWFPVTLAALLGLASRWIRRSPADRPDRVDSTLALYIFFGLLVYVSGYFMWWGGWSYAPRHLIPALPWMALGLVPWLRARRCAWRVALLALAALGAVFNLTAVALDPQMPPTPLLQEALMHPEKVTKWPSPFLLLQEGVWKHHLTAPNWGRALGLTGAGNCFLPLVLVWMGAGAWLAWGARRQRVDEARR